MSILITGYTFNHVAKQVTFPSPPVLENIFLITDVTNNITIYQFNNPALGGSLSGSVLTLDYNTNVAGFADTDHLQIVYTGAYLPSNAAQESGGNLAVLSGGVSGGKYQANINQVGGTSFTLGQQLSGACLPVVLTAAQITTLTPPSTVIVTQATGTNLHAVVDSSALPTGAATSALQTSGNSSLSTIASAYGATGAAVPADASYFGWNNGGNIVGISASNPLPVQVTVGSVVIGKVDIDQSTPGTTNAVSLAYVGNSAISIGQQLSGASLPVVLPASQVTALTPPTTITVTQATGTNLHAVIDSGTVTANAGTGTFAISATALPLPTGASTSALQATGNTSLSDIDTSNAAINTATGTQADTAYTTGNGSIIAVLKGIFSKVGSILTGQTSGTQKTQIVDGSGNVVTSVSNALSVVPSGNYSNNAASHSTTMLGGVMPFIANAAAPSWTEGNNVVASCDLHGNARSLIMDAAGNNRGANVTAGNALTVDGSATTQPISAASLPLPNLAATSTKQSDGSQKSQIVDGSGNVIGSTANALNVNISSGATSGTQYTDGAAAPTHPIGTAPVFNNGGVMTAVSAATGLPVNITGATNITVGPAYNAPALQTFTTSGGSNQVATLSCQSFSTGIAEIYGTYNPNGGTYYFEQQFSSVAGDWKPCSVIIPGGGSPITQFVPLANTSYAFQFTVGAATGFRVRAGVAPSSGTVNCFLAQTTDNLEYGQTVSIANSGFPSNLPNKLQTVPNKSTGAVGILATAFSNNNAMGNSIVVVCAVGNTVQPTVSDSAGNIYALAIFKAGSAFGTAIFYATNIVGGANTVTVTNGSTNASIACTIYEVSGLLQATPGILDQTSSASGTSASPGAGGQAPSSVNDIAFAGFAVGTAAQTITVTPNAPGWTNDSGQQNPTTPTGLFSFVSASAFLPNLLSTNAQATMTSEPWAAASAYFRMVALNVNGTVSVNGGSISLSGTSVVSGNKTNNNSAPGANNIGALIGLANAAKPAWTEGDMVTVSSDLSGNTRMRINDAAGNDRGANVTVANALVVDGSSSIQPVSNQVSAAGGWLPYYANALKANSGAATTISSAAGKFAGCALMNTDAAPVYLQCYDSTSTVTVGTTTPTFVIPYPCNATAGNGLSDRFMLGDVGVNLSNGLKVAATTTAGGATASTNGLTGSIFYK